MSSLPDRWNCYELLRPSDGVAVADPVGMRTTTTYSRAVDGRMYTRTVPVTDAVIASNVCTVTVAAHPFSTGDLVWTENLSLNVASASATPCTVLGPTQVAFALVGPDGQLADHVGNLKARSKFDARDANDARCLLRKRAALHARCDGDASCVA